MKDIQYQTTISAGLILQIAEVLQRMTLRDPHESVVIFDAKYEFITVLDEKTGELIVRVDYS